MEMANLKASDKISISLRKIGDALVPFTFCYIEETGLSLIKPQIRLVLRDAHSFVHGQMEQALPWHLNHCMHQLFGEHQNASVRHGFFLSECKASLLLTFLIMCNEMPHINQNYPVFQSTEQDFAARLGSNN